MKQGPEDFYANVASSSKQSMTTGPFASGSGFFTPLPSDQNGFLGWKPDAAPPQPFRIGQHLKGRDSLSVQDSAEFIHFLM